MHHSAKKLHLEKNAHNRNFVSADWLGKCLNTDRVCLANNGTECQQLSTNLDLDNIVEDCDQPIFQCSDDPGR